MTNEKPDTEKVNWWSGCGLFTEVVRVSGDILGFLFASDVDICFVLQAWPRNRRAPSQRRTWTTLSSACSFSSQGKTGIVLTLVHGITNPRTHHSALLGFTRIYCTPTDCSVLYPCLCKGTVLSYLFALICKKSWDRFCWVDVLLLAVFFLFLYISIWKTSCAQGRKLNILG